ncbi:hypothetical protein [Silvibacterium sp.]|uniref:hypothetical protein n=1 Tax=Silvibacterium sp. TaxID=1964179 RepID=UPI0039E54BD0
MLRDCFMGLQGNEEEKDCCNTDRYHLGTGHAQGALPFMSILIGMEVGSHRNAHAQKCNQQQHAHKHVPTRDLL